MVPGVAFGHARVKTLSVCFLCSAQRRLASALAASVKEILLNFPALGCNAKALAQCLSIET